MEEACAVWLAVKFSQSGKRISYPWGTDKPSVLIRVKALWCKISGFPLTSQGRALWRPAGHQGHPQARVEDGAVISYFSRPAAGRTFVCVSGTNHFFFEYPLLDALPLGERAGTVLLAYSLCAL